MVKTTYYCAITDNTSAQKSHHEKHLKSKTYKQQEAIFRLTIENLSPEERKEKFKGEDNIDKIIEMSKTIIKKPKKETNKLSNKTSNDNNEFIKKSKTNKLIYKKTDKEINLTNENQDFKNKFLTFLGKIHNKLRGASVTGDDALDDIFYCLFLCYIEDKISDSGKFDFENQEHYIKLKPDRVKEFSRCLKVSYLIKNIDELRLKKEDGKCAIQKCAELLSIHPLTEKIFKNEDFIKCQDKEILKDVLEECKKFSKNTNAFEQVDIVGIAYEYIMSKHSGNGGASKEMGQYFTERPLMKMCFELIDKQDLKDLDINSKSTLGDEFCATFGFPIMAKKYFNDKFNIKIKDKNMYGVEWGEKLYKFAFMNSMFSMNNLDNISRGNSFITNVSPHLDISVHNVPFGKSMTPKNIEKTYNSFLTENSGKGYPKFKDYIPFNTKKIDAILASQVVLYKTRKMGLMIIKDGEETSGKSNDKYRKWFMENCIIKKIMKIPSGAFTCTGTKTVCIYFIKKEGHMTENIQFLQLSDDGNKITEICNVSMTDMKQNNYSWDPNSYIIDEEMEKMMKKSKCDWKKLGDVCEDIPSSKTVTGKLYKPGIFNYYSCSREIQTCEKYDYDFTCLLHGSRGSTISESIFFNEKSKFSVGNSIFISICKGNKGNNNLKFIYYYLKINHVMVFKNKITGGGIPMISKDDYYKIQVPIISLETQNKVVQILDDLTEQKQLLSDRKSGIERQMKYYFETQIKKNEVDVKELQEIIKINIGSTPSTKNNSFWDNGQNVWVSVSELNNNLNPITESKKKLTNEAIEKCKPTLVKKGTILMSFKLSIGKLGIAGCDLYTNEAILHINTNNDELNRYLYYHIKSISVNNNATGCLGGGSLNKEKLKVLKIFIQKNLEKQTEIVQYLDKLETKKNSIVDEINDIDILMKNILEQSYN